LDTSFQLHAGGNMSRQGQRKSALVVRPLAAAVLFFLCTLVATGQVTSGTIFGTVKDPSGAIVSGAMVTVINPANGITRVVRSSESGDFVVPNLLPGTYSIAVEA